MVSNENPDFQASSKLLEEQKWGKLDLVISIILVVGSLILVGMHNNSYKTLSPIDELQHLDFTIKASTFHFPGEGERVGEIAMQEAACRSVDAPGYVGPPCNGGPYEPSSFQELGFNTAASQLPTYYITAGLIARGIRALSPIDSFLTAARLSGGIFLGLSLAILWYVMGLLDISRRKRIVPILLLGSTPIVIFHASTVNADAALMLCGSILLLSFLKFEQERLSLAKLLFVCLVTFSVDRSVALAIGALSFALLIQCLPEVKKNSAKVVSLLSIMAVVLISYKVFFPGIHNFLQPQVGSVDEVPMYNAYVTSGVKWDRVVQQLGQVVTPIWNTYQPPFLRTEGIRMVMTISNWLVIGSLLHISFSKNAGQLVSKISSSTFTTFVLAGPLYTFIYAYFSGWDFAAPGRFGLSLLPFTAIPIAKSLEKRATTAIFYLLAAMSALLTFRAMI